MIPILYESTEKEFTTQGIGTLSDAISCSVTEERNNTYELEMEYPMDGVHYSDIVLNNIIMAIPSDGANKQAFRIYQITRPINGVVTVYAEHISYQLSNIPVKPFSAKGVIAALNGLIENSIEDNPFTVWTDIDNVEDTYSQSEPASFRSRLGGVTGSIIDCFGGEFEFDMYKVNLHSSRGSFKEVTVEYGKNLTDIEQEELLSNVVTGIVPFWTSTSEDEETTMVTLPEYVVESEYAEKYPFKRTIVKDFSSDFDEQPTEDELRSYTEKYIANNAVGEPEVSIDFDFVELSDTEEYKNLAREHIKLCDTIVVKFSKLGINQKAKVRKTEYDVLAERYTSITIGSSTNNFVKTISEIQKETEKQATDFATMLRNALALQKSIMDGNLGGNMVTNYVNGKPAELVFGDTDDISTMQKCLRIGKEGIAISVNGYEGPFESAWTVAEGFNGKFIMAGSITGNAIKANSVTVGNLDESLQDNISEGVEANEKASENAKSIENLQKQVDGQIETWFYDYAPADDKEPTSEWTTDVEKDKHIGDLFYDNTTGYSYRYTLQDGTYSWIQLSDSDITKALEEAQKAQTTANSKRRVFVTTPVVPYDIGDLWVQGSSNNSEESTTAEDDTDVGDILVCANAKSNEELYDRDDWVLASNYTDDTLANMAQLIANNAQQSADNAQDSATAANEKADNAQASADSANDKADNAQQSADNAQASADSANEKASKLENNISDINSKINTINSSISSNNDSLEELQKQLEEEQDSMNQLVQQIRNLGIDTLSELLQRTTIDSTGITVRAVEDGTSYIRIQNNGVHIYANGKNVSNFMADSADVARLFFQEGKIGMHIVDIFSEGFYPNNRLYPNDDLYPSDISSEEGTAFFYDEGGDS